MRIPLRLGLVFDHDEFLNVFASFFAHIIIIRPSPSLSCTSGRQIKALLALPSQIPDFVSSQLGPGWTRSVNLSFTAAWNPFLSFPLLLEYQYVSGGKK